MQASFLTESLYSRASCDDVRDVSQRIETGYF